MRWSRELNTLFPDAACEHETQEINALIPPVPEKLGIKAEIEHRISACLCTEGKRLPSQVIKEVVCMQGNLLGCCCRIIQTLRLVTSCDGKIFISGEHSDIGLMDVWPDIVHVKVIADVAVEFPVIRIAGIACRIRPDKVRDAPVSGEACNGRVIKPDRLIACAQDLVARCYD